MSEPRKDWPKWKERMHEVIFEAETPAGRIFDVLLLWLILGSLLIVSLDSVAVIRNQFGSILYWCEWIFTLVFTVEYVLRVVSMRKPLGYVFSFFGIVDFLSIVPTYLSLFLPGIQSLLVIRSLRLIRVFRIFKLTYLLKESSVLRIALINSRGKIAVFLMTVLLIAASMGALMYVIEGEANGFTSIPKGIYWAIVTMTTVGYGDISPQTPLGQLVASAVMILGYGIIAVPTGIVSIELAEASKKLATVVCPDCALEGHERDAVFCRKCSARL